MLSPTLMARRLAIASIALGLFGASFLVGYYSGYAQAWHEAYFQPAVIYADTANQDQTKTGR